MKQIKPLLLLLAVAAAPAFSSWELVPGTGGCTGIAIDPDGIYCKTMDPIPDEPPPPVTIISDPSEFPRIRWEGPEGQYSLGLDMLNDQFTYNQVLTKEISCPTDPETGTCQTVVFATHNHTYRYQVYSRTSGEYSGYWIIVY